MNPYRETLKITGLDSQAGAGLKSQAYLLLSVAADDFDGLTSPPANVLANPVRLKFLAFSVRIRRLRFRTCRNCWTNSQSDSIANELVHNEARRSPRASSTRRAGRHGHKLQKHSRTRLSVPG